MLNDQSLQHSLQLLLQNKNKQSQAGRKNLFMARASFILALFVFFAECAAWPHVFTTDSSGNPKRWSDSSVEFFANYLNNSGLSSAQVRTAITNSLSRWKSMGTAALSFDYWQGSTTVTPRVSLDSRNVIYFQSQSSSVTLGSGVIGVTYIYSSGTRIVEADVVLNDRDFDFTMVSTDTTNGNVFNDVFIENVLTHELGHAYGLSHSNQLQSVMMWQESKGQAKLSCDDINGMAVAYPSASYTASLGSISGTVYNSTGVTAIFGAYVHAISKRRGIAIATAITNPSGAFTLQNLEPGQYSLMVEPFTNITSALCGGSASGCYWGTANALTTCSGSAFSRFFVASSPGYGALISASAGSTTSIGSINVSCSAMTQLISNVAAASFPASTPAVISSVGSSTSASAAIHGVFSGAAGVDTHYYKLDTVAGTIKAKALSYSLYSTVDIDVDIVDSSDTTVATTQYPNIFPIPAPVGLPTPYINYDSAATYTSAPSGTYYVRVKYNGSLSSGVFPGPAARDSTAFYFLLITLNDTTALVTDSTATPYLTENARCEKTDNFSAYSDRGTPPALESASSSSSSSSSLGTGSNSGGCGTIKNDSGKDKGEPPGAGALFSAWGMLTMLLLSRLAFKFSHR